MDVSTNDHYTFYNEICFVRSLKFWLFTQDRLTSIEYTFFTDLEIIWHNLKKKKLMQLYYIMQPTRGTVLDPRRI